jgi:hypothetical protein
VDVEIERGQRAKIGMMQAKDIADETFLEAVRFYNDGEAAEQVHVFAGFTFRSTKRWALVWDLQGIGPEKVIRAKVRKLIGRGLLDGCPCGCRGDFEITDKGRVLLDRTRMTT